MLSGDRALVETNRARPNRRGGVVLTDFERLIREEQKKRFGRHGKVESFLEANPDAREKIDELVDAFVTVRRDSGPVACSWQVIADLITEHTGLDATAKTIQKFITALHPDEPTLRE